MDGKEWFIQVSREQSGDDWINQTADMQAAERNRLRRITLPPKTKSVQDPQKELDKLKQTHPEVYNSRTVLTRLFVTHPRLEGGRVTLIRPRGEKLWRVVACKWPNGKTEGGIEPLSKRDLMLDSHSNDIPRIIGKDED